MVLKLFVPLSQPPVFPGLLAKGRFSPGWIVYCSMLYTAMHSGFEWQWIIATINRGIGPRRICRATPPTIPDR
jgi:hypothetical protein